jgi:hypothetical protein
MSWLSPLKDKLGRAFTGPYLHSCFFFSNLQPYSSCSVVTILFNAYIREEDFREVDVLPSEILTFRYLNNRDDFNLDLVRGAYLQEELRHKDAFAKDLQKSLDFYCAELLGITPPRPTVGTKRRKPIMSPRKINARLSAFSSSPE